MSAKLTKDDIAEIFEKCWSELCEEYPQRRKEMAFFSEADLHAHLTRKLLDALPPGWVHVEFPLQLGQIETLEGETLVFGRPRIKKHARGEGYKVDIAIVDPHERSLCLMAELKLNKLDLSLDWLRRLSIQEPIEREKAEVAKKELRRYLRFLKGTRIGRKNLREYLLSNIRNLSASLRELRGLRQNVRGYLCVIDEWYSSAPLEEELRKAVRGYSRKITVLVRSYSVEESIEETLRSLETRSKL